jgi:hypothetical protein
MSDKYIYLFTRRDLSPQQQIIQTAHAVHAMANNSSIDETPNAVLIGIHSENALLDIKDYLEENKIPNEMFYEPDIAAHTAIATYPLAGKERTPLKKFGLM